MKTIILILLATKLSAQVVFEKEAKNFYLAMGTSIILSEILHQKTDLGSLSPVFEALSGILMNSGKKVIQNKWARRDNVNLGNGKVGFFGAITGGIAHRIYIDIKDKKTKSESSQRIKIKTLLIRVCSETSRINKLVL